MPAARWIAFAAYLCLVAAVAGWEGWAAPAMPVPRAFWLALKLIPLAIPLPWLVRASPRAHVAAALLLLLYFCEGVAIAYAAAQTGAAGALAYGSAQTALSVLFIVAASVYARLSFRAGAPRVRAGTES